MEHLRGLRKAEASAYGYEIADVPKFHPSMILRDSSPRKSVRAT